MQVFRVLYRDSKGGMQNCVVAATDLGNALTKATPVINSNDASNVVIGVEFICTLDVA